MYLTSQKIARELKVHIGFDAIGEKDSLILAELIEDKGAVYNYGLLSGLNPKLISLQLIFQQKLSMDCGSSLIYLEKVFWKLEKLESSCKGIFIYLLIIILLKKIAKT